MKKIILSLVLGYGLTSVSIAQNYTAAESGYAIYYADYLDGQPTSTGEAYQMFEMTCASRNYPVGTILRISRIDTRRAVNVRVNDTQLYCKDCIVMVSKAAAAELDLLKLGKVRVILEVAGFSDTNPPSPYAQRNTRLQEDYLQEKGANYGYVGQQNQQVQGQQSYYNAPPASYDQVGNSRPAYDPRSYYDGYVPGTQNSQIVRDPYSNSYQEAPVNPGGYYSGNANIQQRQETRQQYPAGYDNYSRSNFNTQTNQNQQYTDQYGNYYYSNATPSNNQDNWQAKGAAQNPIKNTQPNAYDQNLAATSKAKAPTSSSGGLQRFPAGQAGYIIQVASYQQLDNAERQAFNLQQQGVEYLYLKEDASKDGAVIFRLVIGVFPDFAQAQQYLYHIQTQFLLDGVVTKLK